METLKIVMVLLIVISQVSGLFLIGKYRKPITPGIYLIQVITSTLLVIALLS